MKAPPLLSGSRATSTNVACGGIKTGGELSDLRKFCPLSVHQLVELEGGLGGAAAHPGEVARHTDVTVSPGEGGVSRDKVRKGGSGQLLQMREYSPEGGSEVYLIDKSCYYGEGRGLAGSLE